MRPFLPPLPSAFLRLTSTYRGAGVETGATDAAGLGTIGVVGMGVGEKAGVLFRIGAAVGTATLRMVSLSGSGTTGVLAGRTVGAGLLVGTGVALRWSILLVWPEANATVT